MNSGPVVAMVWENSMILKTSQVMLGEIFPADLNQTQFKGISAFKLEGTSFTAVIAEKWLERD